MRKEKRKDHQEGEVGDPLAAVMAAVLISDIFRPEGDTRLETPELAGGDRMLLPPDLLLMALALERRARAFWYSAVCTLGSVAGAVLGWYIGATLWEALGVAHGCPEMGGGAWLFEHVPGFRCDAFEQVSRLFRDNAILTLFTAGFTPIPFKVVTVAAGVCQVDLPILILGSLVGRTPRYFLIGGLLYFAGPPVKRFIEARFELLTVVCAVLFIAGFVLMKYAL